MDPNDTKISALLELLQDDDPKVASLAMEQFLKLGELAEETIALHQESQDPHLRHRIHQLGTILLHRRTRRQFIDAVHSEGMSLWEGVCRINELYDPRLNRARLDVAVSELLETLGRGEPGAARLAAFMRAEEFTVPTDDMLRVELYLAEDVLANTSGSPALLCALTHHLGQASGWNATLVLHEGRYCLIDDNQLLVDPTAGWQVAKLQSAAKIHPCSCKDLWIGVLSQLFLVALVDGDLRDLHHFGDLLVTLNGNAFDSLPYPLGTG